MEIKLDDPEITVEASSVFLQVGGMKVHLSDHYGLLSVMLLPNEGRALDSLAAIGAASNVLLLKGVKAR